MKERNRNVFPRDLKGGKRSREAKRVNVELDARLNAFACLWHGRLALIAGEEQAEARTCGIAGKQRHAVTHAVRDADSRIKFRVGLIGQRCRSDRHLAEIVFGIAAGQEHGQPVAHLDLVLHIEGQRAVFVRLLTGDRRD